MTGGEELLAAAHAYLDPLIADVDTLILGCTHYPLLTAVISYVMGDQVTLVSSAEETAKDVYKLRRRATPCDLAGTRLPVPDHGHAGGVRAHRATVPGPELPWAPSSPGAGRELAWAA